MRLSRQAGMRCRFFSIQTTLLRFFSPCSQLSNFLPPLLLKTPLPLIRLLQRRKQIHHLSPNRLSHRASQRETLISVSVPFLAALLSGSGSQGILAAKLFSLLV